MTTLAHLPHVGAFAAGEPEPRLAVLDAVSLAQSRALRGDDPDRVLPPLVDAIRHAVGAPGVVVFADAIRGPQHWGSGLDEGEAIEPAAIVARAAESSAVLEVAGGWGAWPCPTRAGAACALAVAVDSTAGVERLDAIDRALGPVTTAIGAMVDAWRRRQADSAAPDTQHLLATLGHELRGPLGSIRGALGLIAGNHRERLPPKVGHIVGLAHRDTERVLGLVHDLVTVERLRSGRIPFRFTTIDPRALTAAALQTHRRVVGSRPVFIQSEPGRPALPLFGDSRRLGQVVDVLVGNAARCAPLGTVIRVRVDGFGEVVRFAVTDSGPSLDDSTRSRVFQAFGTIAEPPAPRRDATGLGYALARLIIERHGGAIGVDSAPGGCTTFWFVLPIAPDAREAP